MADNYDELLDLAQIDKFPSKVCKFVHREDQVSTD